MADVETLIDRIDALVSRYYHHADEETRAVINNLTGIHVLMSRLIVSQAVERDHWATEARNAVEARDEALRLLSRADDENARLRAIEQEYNSHYCMNDGRAS